MDGNSTSEFDGVFGSLESDETSTTSHEETFGGQMKSETYKIQETEKGVDTGGAGDPKAESQNYTQYPNLDAKVPLKSGDLKECFKTQTESLYATISQWGQTFQELELFEEQVAQELEIALKHAQYLNDYTNKQKDECKQRLQALSKALSLF